MKRYIRKLERIISRRSSLDGSQISHRDISGKASCWREVPTCLVILLVEDNMSFFYDKVLRARCAIEEAPLPIFTHAKTFNRSSEFQRITIDNLHLVV